MNNMQKGHIPMTHTLIAGLTRLDYDRALINLVSTYQRLFPTKELDLNKKKVHVDWDLNFVAALKAKWPQVIIVYCL
jgi:hypothetical protein